MVLFCVGCSTKVDIQVPEDAIYSGSKIKKVLIFKEAETIGENYLYHPVKMTFFYSDSDAKEFIYSPDGNLEMTSKLTSEDARILYQQAQEIK